MLSVVVVTSFFIVLFPNVICIITIRSKGDTKDDGEENVLLRTWSARRSTMVDALAAVDALED